MVCTFAIRIHHRDRSTQKIMKNIYLILAAGLLLSSCGPTTVVESSSYQPAPPPVAEVSYQSFYDQLAPYGNWINYPGYGYVWMPNAGPDFKPYASNGNWIYTEAGWTWSSNYSWGWAPFHYGRWFYENGYGWLWVPGNEWAPAWVSWRGNGDYYGWAPMGPRVSVDIALNSYEPPTHYWNFVPSRYMGNPGWHNYYVNETQNVTIIKQTTIINNYSGTNRARYSYAPGPDPNEVSRASGNHITPVQIREANTPGERVSESQYVVYHPRVNAEPAARGDAAGRPATPAPAHYESFSNVHPSNQYPAYNQPANNARSMGETPNNYQPTNNPRSASEHPNNGQLEYNPKPAETNPGNNQPAYGNRPAYNQPNTASHPANNPPPAVQNPSTGPNPNHLNPTSGSHPQAFQAKPIMPTQANTGQSPNNNLPKPSPANHVQTNNKPSNPHNPNSGQPQQKTNVPEKKPEQKTEDKPKPAGNNN
jgi:hypothetical protein